MQSLATIIDPEIAPRKAISVKVVFTDKDKTFLLFTRYSVLHFREAGEQLLADASIKLTHCLFVDMLTDKVGLAGTLMSDELAIEGSFNALLQFFRLFDEKKSSFNIVTP